MRTRTLLLVTIAALSLAACDAAVEQLSEEAVERVAEAAGAGDTEIDMDEDGGNISIETDEGSVQIGAGDGTELPEGLPDSIPLPEDYTVVSSSTFTDEDGESILVMLEVTDLDPTAFIEDEVVPGLESSGCEIGSQTTTSGSGGARSSVQAGCEDASVNVSALVGEDGGGIVNISVFPPE